MRKVLSIASFIGAGILAVGFIEHSIYAPAFGCIGWLAIWLAAQRKKPRGSSQGKDSAKNLYLYDITTEKKLQDEIRLMKAWEESA